MGENAKMMTLEKIKQGLENYKLNRVAREAGVDKCTLYRMMRENSNPSYETVKKLSDWLGGAE